MVNLLTPTYSEKYYSSNNYVNLTLKKASFQMYKINSVINTERTGNI